MQSNRPWQRPSTPAPVVDAAIVTPVKGPSEQEPPQPVVLQNALVGAGITGLTNAMTTGLTQAPEILWCSMGLNAVAQGVKQFAWFNEKKWTIWLLIFLGIFLMCWYYRDVEHWDLLHFWMPGYLELPGKGLLQGMTSAFQSLANYHGLAATGVTPMRPTPLTSSVEGRG